MKVLFIILILFLSTFLSAQYSYWINYSDPVYPTCIVCSRNDVWIGSYGGLIKLDQQTDQMTFFTKASSGIPSNIIRSLAVDSSENIWIGTDKDGIGKFNGQNTIVYNMNNSQLPSDNWNTEIEVDQYGNIWIGSYRFLSKFDGSEWKIYEAAPGLVAFHSINDIKFDKKGTVWIGDYRGLSKLENNILYQQFGGFNKETNAIQVDTICNKIWIGTNNDGLYCYDGSNWIKYDSSNSLITGSAIYDIKYDSKGNLWFGTNDGLIKYDGLNWQAYNKYNSPLPSNIIKKFDIDDYDNFWISASEKIIKFDKINIKLYDLQNSGIALNRVESIAEDDLSNKWISCYNILTKFNGKGWESFNEANYDKLDLILTRVYEDSSKILWKGSNLLILFRNNQEWIVSEISNRHKGGLIKEDINGNIWLAGGLGPEKFDGNHWTIYNSNNSSLPTNIVARIAFDYKNNLLLSTTPSAGEKGELIKYDGMNWSTFYTCENIHDWISGIEIDSANNLWLGILNRSNVGIEYGGGLKKFDGTKWENYNIYNSDLPSNSITELCFDEKKNLWIGTYGGGAAEFDGKGKWRVYSKYNSGLPSVNIENITVDKANNKWFGVQSNGLTVFNEEGIILTDIGKTIPNRLPKDFVLNQNYPNPFNPVTVISYQLPASLNPSQGGTFTHVELKVYDMLGREIAVLVNEDKPAGTYRVSFDGRNLSSGVYFYQLKAGSFIDTKKFVLLR